MKPIIIPFIIIVSLSFPMNKHIIGGFTLSKVAGDTADDLEDSAKDDGYDFDWDLLYRSC